MFNYIGRHEICGLAEYTYREIIVEIKVLFVCSRVLYTEASPCKFDHLYDILVCAFVYTCPQRVEDEDLA